MKEVKIYIETSLTGPVVKKGRYGALVEFIKASGEPVTREIYGEEEETTYYRSTLLAMVKAMKLLKAPCKILIYTYCTFIKGMVEGGNLEAWHRAEWKKASGEEVQNKELWQEFLDLAGVHEIEFRYSKHHEYRNYLKGKVIGC